MSNVLILREPDKAAELKKRLLSLSHQVDVYSPIIIKALQPNKVPAITPDSIVVFISQNAVQNTPTDWFQELKKIDVTVIAVGPATKKALEAVGIKAKSPQASYDLKNPHSSEGVLQMKCWNKVTPDHVVIVRGLGGREHLKDALTSKGIGVEYLEVYERIQVSISPEVIQSVSIGLYQTVIAYSFEGLKVFTNSLHQSNIATNQLDLVVLGQSMANKAESLKFKSVIAAQDSSVDSFVTAVKSLI